MNIFSILNRGRRSLNEDSISAILAYFLDPKEDHGLGSVFLEAFWKLTTTLEVSNYDFSNAEVELEAPLESGENFDIEVIVYPKEDGGHNSKVHRFLIENKIHPAAANPMQLKNYYEAYRKDPENKNANITVVFIVPSVSSESLREEYDLVVINQSQDEKVMLYWQNSEMGENKSIQGIIRNILTKESVGKMSPINDYVQHTLKAFAMHLGHILVSSKTRRSKKSKKEATSKDDQIVLVNSGDQQILMAYGYEIMRQKHQYFVYENDKKVQAKPALRKIIKERNLGINLQNTQGVDYTTYQLGSRVWKILLPEATKSGIKKS